MNMHKCCRTIFKRAEEKQDTGKTIQEDINEINKNLEKYYQENDDIDFLFEQINQESTLKKLDKYIKSFEESIQLIQNVKAMLTSFDER
jgi:L-lactate utilization protein LutB